MPATDAVAYDWPTNMLEAVGPRLSPTAAERLASRLVEAMTRTRDSHQLARLARGLRAVGAGLSAGCPNGPPSGSSRS